MLITKEVLIFNKLVKIEDLSLNSHKKICAKCDNCSKEKEITYQLFNLLTKNNTNDYYCNNKECINKKRQLSIQDKYGVDNVFQLNDIKDKIKETNLELYGVENPQQNKEIKNKTENTNLERYGVKNPFQSELIKEKMKITNLKNYGTEHPSQNKDFLYKKLKNGAKINYIDHLYYQGSYEKEFILKYKDKIKIENGLSVEYYYLDEKKIYHSDFYLPEYNLVIEIKSTYWYNKNLEMCKAKEEYTKKTYDYLMILDKNYIEFDKLLYPKQHIINRK